MGTLLIAGAWTADATGELGGAGALAAIAAAPLGRTQCWGRCASGVTSQVRALAERRGADLAGLDESGDDDLGGTAPTTAEGVSACLLVGLDAATLHAGRSVIDRLEGAEDRAVILAGNELAALRAVAADASLVITTIAACRQAGFDDPLAAAKAIQSEGAKTVAITAGVFGGLLAYQGKLTTWNAWPVDTTHAGALPAFAGALAAWCAGSDKTDFATIKRGLGVASAVGSLYAQGGIRRLFASRREEYLERFTKLRRDAK